MRLEVMPFIPWHRICKYFVQAPRLEVELQDGKQVNLVQKASAQHSIQEPAKVLWTAISQISNASEESKRTEQLTFYCLTEKEMRPMRKTRKAHLPRRISFIVKCKLDMVVYTEQRGS